MISSIRYTIVKADRQLATCTITGTKAMLQNMAFHILGVNND